MGSLNSKTGAMTRYGGVRVSGTGVSSGNIITLGNLLGDVSIAGSLGGRIAAQGVTISGVSSSRVGILSSISFSSGITSSGAVLRWC
jgi:hypothetical protein